MHRFAKYFAISCAALITILFVVSIAKLQIIRAINDATGCTNDFDNSSIKFAPKVGIVLTNLKLTNCVAGVSATGEIVELYPDWWLLITKQKLMIDRLYVKINKLDFGKTQINAITIFMNKNGDWHNLVATGNLLDGVVKITLDGNFTNNKARLQLLFSDIELAKLFTAVNGRIKGKALARFTSNTHWNSLRSNISTQILDNAITNGRVDISNGKFTNLSFTEIIKYFSNDGANGVSMKKLFQEAKGDRGTSFNLSADFVGQGAIVNMTHALIKIDKIANITGIGKINLLKQKVNSSFLLQISSKQLVNFTINGKLNNPTISIDYKKTMSHIL